MKTPKVPDYEAAAKEQGAANLETAKFNATANRPNVYTPYGSQVWTQDPNDPNRSVLTESLSPEEQAKYALSSGIEKGGLEAVQAAMPQIRAAISEGGFSLPGQAATGFLPGTEPEWGISHGISGEKYNALPQLTGEVGYRGPGIPTADDATRRRHEAALYRRSTGPLDRQFGESQAALESQLANMGLARGSESWNREMARMAEEKRLAYGDARDRAITGGGEEMQRLFDMGLGANAQGWGQAMDAAGLRNAARQQGVGELIDVNQMWNKNVMDNHNLQFAKANLFNQGRAQQLQELQMSKLLPINVMASMLGTSQVQYPQFQPFNNNIQADAAPLFQGAVAQGQGNIAQANARNSLIGQGVQAAGSVAALLV